MVLISTRKDVEQGNLKTRLTECQETALYRAAPGILFAFSYIRGRFAGDPFLSNGTGHGGGLLYEAPEKCVKGAKMGRRGIGRDGVDAGGRRARQ
jgi:hypothetical protein